MLHLVITGSGGKLPQIVTNCWRLKGVLLKICFIEAMNLSVSSLLILIDSQTWWSEWARQVMWFKFGNVILASFIPFIIDGAWSVTTSKTFSNWIPFGYKICAAFIKAWLIVTEFTCFKDWVEIKHDFDVSPFNFPTKTLKTTIQRISCVIDYKINIISNFISDFVNCLFKSNVNIIFSQSIRIRNIFICIFIKKFFQFLVFLIFQMEFQRR